jgi:biofilm PGA synthesis N-glycosyltransferase PgaC
VIVATAHAVLEFVLLAIPSFCFGYPFVMAWYWIAGAVIYYFVREYNAPPQDKPPPLDHWPPISIIVPCYNESDNAEETLSAAAAVDYPEFEVIAVNDGSRDNTAEVLDRLAGIIPRLRVVHLAKNQGKATAMNTGALLARHELLVCIDGDALLDPQALRWTARVFSRADVGAMAGNPRIRNRTSLLGRLQVGEFSSIIGLIRRAQSSYGRLFTVSGVLCAFRKRALEDANWWSSRTITDDIDVTWRVQMTGWRVIFEPNAIVWILMPETLRGLWKQRVRWAEGGVEMMVDFFRPVMSGRAPSLLPTYLNFVVSLLWAYTMTFCLIVGLLWAVGVPLPSILPGFQLVPEWWGLTLSLTYLAQALTSHLIERRYERNMLRSLFWIIWYPMAFWLISTLTTVVALPRALSRPRRATWDSPDRGLR